MIGDEEHEGMGSESGGMMRWLITYADLITLLLAFFIILYAINRTQQIKFSLVAQALANQFDSKSIVGQGLGPSVITQNSGISTLAAQKQQLQSLSHLQNRIQSAIRSVGLTQEVSVHSNARGVEVSLSASTLFASGSARLSPGAVILLDRVGGALASVPNDVEVVGYTDSTPIRTALYPSNWQLSAMRAANVVYVLSRVPHINPQRLSLSGFGRYHPVATNRTAVGRSENRRVNILVLRNSVAQVAIGNGP